MSLFMSKLYKKIKIKIDINNDELLETIWEHMKDIILFHNMKKLETQNKRNKVVME